ncbi:YTH domain-containing protein ECT2 [Linum perenne]
MDSASLEDQDRIVPTVVAGETLEGDSLGGQPLSPKDERVVAGIPSSDLSVIGPSRSAIERPHIPDVSGGLRIIPPLEQNFSYGSYGDGTWDGYTQYPNAAEGLHISPVRTFEFLGYHNFLLHVSHSLIFPSFSINSIQVIYNDNASLIFPSGYGFNPDMSYGQYSPVATPMPSIMLDGQLYSPQQIPYSPSFYPPHTPNFPSSFPLSPSELIGSEGNSESLLYGPGSGYFVPYGSYGGGSFSGAPGSSPLASPAGYHQPMGILGPYEHHIGQISQQRPIYGFGSSSTSSLGRFQRGGSHQYSNSGRSYVSFPGDRTRLGLDKGRREREQESLYLPNESFGLDRNRGPRASKLRSKSVTEQASSGNGRGDTSGSEVALSVCNCQDFVTDYDNATFFIIKSFSEDNVHKSMKYGVWASTPHGNKKLDAAYTKAKETDLKCPVFLLFSVNASGQFCGVAEMLGSVDFGKDADYWQQDRWTGQFPVRWHIVKDVPNSRFRHILLENNDNKPVTHSRDCQEVKLEHGIEMLKIFKAHDSYTSILDDFEFYDQRERVLKERRSKHQAIQTMDSTGLLGYDTTISKISNTFAQTVQLDDGSKQAPTSEVTSSLRTDPVHHHGNDSGPVIEAVSKSSRIPSSDKDFVASRTMDALNLEDEDCQSVQRAELGCENQDSTH